MGRALRPNFSFAVYHVTMRGNDRRDIFRDDLDREMMLALFGEAQERFRLEIFAFCLMSNHYHIFLRTPEANLSPAFQWINAVYTKRFNHRHHRSGHVFQGRFKSMLVTRDAHWQQLSIYIHLNPVRAGMVTDPADYPWSSYRDYIHERGRHRWLSAEPILTRYAPDPAGQRKLYRKHTLALARSEPVVWSSLFKEIFADGDKADKPSAAKAKAAPMAVTPRERCRPELELERIATAFGVTKADLLRKRRNFPPRLAAYYHLVHHCGLAVKQTAQIMGVGPGSVSCGLKAFRDSQQSQPNLARKLPSP
jgi:REP element-mobilizing transposase RayT